MTKLWATILSISFLLLGIGLTVYFALNKSFNDGSGIINPELASSYGSLISGVVGPIFSIVGFLILYITIVNQQESFNIQQFESKYFELIKFHRENVNQITYKPSSYKNETEIFGRNVFIELKKQLGDLFIIIKPIIENVATIKRTKVDEISLNVTYLVFFFGVGKNTKESLKSALIKQKLEPEIVDQIVNIIREEKTKYNPKIVYYGGHQSKLGFYFRHMYQTVKFVENQKFLSDDKKKEYIKIFRAQLTTYEQAILFYDSMSALGKEWQTKGWITKYKLIKNIPEKFLGEIEPKSYYPKIKFEYELQNISQI